MEDIGGILSSNKTGERGKNGREVKENMGEMKRRKKHELREALRAEGK